MAYKGPVFVTRIEYFVVPMLLTNRQTVIVAGQRIAFSCEGKGPALVILDERAPQWSSALQRHYRVIRIEEGLSGDDVQGNADRILSLLRIINVHNPHLLVGSDYLAHAVELLTRPQDMVSWHSAALLSSSDSRRIQNYGKQRLWRLIKSLLLFKGRRRHPNMSEAARKLSLEQQQRWQRALTRNNIPCRIIEAGPAITGDELWDLFRQAERVSIGSCPRALLGHIEEALIAFHGRVKLQRRRLAGM